jgi:hypothetical protein
MFSRRKYRDFLFAPDDLPPFVATPKENQHGIGYRGLDRTSMLGSRPVSGHINLFEMPAAANRSILKYHIQGSHNFLLPIFFNQRQRKSDIFGFLHAAFIKIIFYGFYVVR